jgi:tRNA dimethylallyltransferase
LDDAELRIICGPTAAGKSAIALRLAEAVGAAIVSADSRQIYRGFDIGTAKPSRDERARVPHFGIDVADPAQRYSAAKFASEAPRWMEEARTMGRVPLIVGGTGFYLRALVTPLFREPALDEHSRAALTGFLATLSTADLRRWCEVLDRPRAHLGRAQLLRAVEIAVLTGARISELHERRRGEPSRAARWLLVNPSPSALARRIEARTHEMLRAGWEDEVRQLMDIVPDDAPSWKGTGYETLRERVRGHITREAAIARIVVETRQYAKRQRTWFRHQLPRERVTHLDPGAADAHSVAERWWRGEAA